MHKCNEKKILLSENCIPYEKIILEPNPEEEGSMKNRCGIWIYKLPENKKSCIY
jgi:hypothetical protein